MAYTANTGFRYYADMRGNLPSPVPVPVRIANSTTLRVGDVVRVNNAGFLVASGTSNPAAGVLVGFRDNFGITPFSLGYNKGGLTLTGDDTAATSATNQTRADFLMGEVVMDPAGDILWRNKASSSLAQTNLLQYFDVDSNSRQIDVSTASDANGEFQLIRIDPEGTTIEGSNVATADATIGLFRLARNQFGVLVDNATAKVAA